MSNIKDEFTVKFRGVRGSYNVYAENALKYGGNTSCVEVNVNGHTIIIDSGSGIIELGNELTEEYSDNAGSDRAPLNLTILFSHAHYDHISGLPFFKPAYINTSNLHLFGHDTENQYFKSIITNFIRAPYFPVNFDEIPAKININSISSSDTIVFSPDNPVPEIKQLTSEKMQNIHEDAVLISCFKSKFHPKDGILVFKITYKNHNMVYASDIEGCIGENACFVDFIKGADLLIHDAQYTSEDYYSPVASKKGYGHSTPEIAADVAKQGNVKKLVLYHMDPSYNFNIIESMENDTKKLFENTIAAREGLEISLI